MKKLCLGILAMLAVTGALASSASAAPQSNLMGPTMASLTSVACSPGGPYHEGDDAVWYNCNGDADLIYVRRHFPLSNYEVCVPAYGSYRTSWFWTKTMEFRGYC